ncbi:diacylglycerol kinase (ATP) [Geoalkalibacter ferrihydriticus]|uniref:Diacylglycerol kinase n=2 Tax=Geoalkalibacter ferrihydriticus TaxID=392333 RepID=A0A0C2EAZ2_9BACT|nr:diacylglycerol kinase [Geoalkalibacter ferrihydriticus]KIH75748.1 diacylglycerol kinase [Geoalkalibacter ferrihydriticus DSM 17813]SDM63261.1 diacylglycerol kinase (ATP) [Geoalkalibacter ferrihydriticus]
MNSSPEQPKQLKPGNWYQSVNCAIEGIIWAARTQRHMRIHLMAAVGVLLAAVILRVSALEFILLTLAVILVLFAELFNTAIEVVVDLVSPEYHPLAKIIKDLAAGAVLMACIGAVVLGYLALSSHFFGTLGRGLGLLEPPKGEVAVVSILIVVILVVLFKALSGRGRPLYGGMPSGHSAVAFSIATAVALSGVAPAVILLTLMLAVMVSHSRLLMEIHSLVEVLAGALLGISVTLSIYFLL